MTGKFDQFDAAEALDLADELDLVRMLLAGYLETRDAPAEVMAAALGSGEDDDDGETGASSSPLGQAGRRIAAQLSTVVELVDAIKGLALAQQKLRADTAFTPAEAQALMSQLGEVALKYVPQQLRANFVQEIRQLFGGDAAGVDVEEIGAGPTLRG
jgi:hypothetical protein